LFGGKEGLGNLLLWTPSSLGRGKKRNPPLRFNTFQTMLKKRKKKKMGRLSRKSERRGLGGGRKEGKRRVFQDRIYKILFQLKRGGGERGIIRRCFISATFL